MPRPKKHIKQRPITCLEKEAIWLDVKRTALILGVSQPFLRKMAREGAVPAHKVGVKLWRFKRDELEQFMTST